MSVSKIFLTLETIWFRAVRRYAKKVKAHNKEKIMERILTGERYSVTTDEYTSVQNKRFSAVSLHPSTGRPIKIGMTRIYGSLPGKKAASDLNKKLEEYGLEEGLHTVANTTDGASVMCAMGKQLKGRHQICHSHGIHLAGKKILKMF